MAKKRKAVGKSNKRAPSQSTGPIWGVCFLLLLGLIVVGGLNVVESAAETRTLYQSLGEVQRQHDHLLEEHSRLSIERGTMSSLQKIETVALDRLGMVFPVHIEQVTDG
jgi:cell division protein FtsL